MLSRKLKFEYGFIIFLRFHYAVVYGLYIHNNNVTHTHSVLPKIVGGRPVNIEQYPFAVQFLNMGRLCGGVILSSWTIITAAHCVEFSTDISQMMIQVGAKYTYDFNADRYKILSFVIHEHYSKAQPFSCDIALLFLEKPIQFGAKAKKSILVSHDNWMNKLQRNFIVTGWGFTKHDGEVSKVGLQMATLRYIPPKQCSKMLDGYKLTEDMFCLYGSGKRDTCQGDSGGGVLWNNMLVGLTSHGEGCAGKYKPSVYANVWVLRNWIKNHAEIFVQQYCDNRFTNKTNIFE